MVDGVMKFKGLNWPGKYVRLKRACAKEKQKLSKILWNFKIHHSNIIFESCTSRDLIPNNESDGMVSWRSLLIIKERCEWYSSYTNKKYWKNKMKSVVDMRFLQKEVSSIKMIALNYFLTKLSSKFTWKQVLLQNKYE